jgi:hypothetical protein
MTTYQQRLTKNDLRPGAGDTGLPKISFKAFGPVSVRNRVDSRGFGQNASQREHMGYKLPRRRGSITLKTAP